jgi:hypothetical protein
MPVISGFFRILVRPRCCNMLGMHMMRKLVSRLCPELCRKIAVIPTNNIYIFPLISSIANPNISPSLTLWLFSTLSRASTCQKALCNLSGSTKASTPLRLDVAMRKWHRDHLSLPFDVMYVYPLDILLAAHNSDWLHAFPENSTQKPAFRNPIQ